MQDRNSPLKFPRKFTSPIVNRVAPAIPDDGGLAYDQTVSFIRGSVPGRRINVLASLKSHQLLALSVALLILGAGIGMAWMWGKATFYTEAVIYVAPPHPYRTEGGRESELTSGARLREYMQQQLQTVNRYDNILATLRNHPESARNWRHGYESEQRTVERLQASLIIRQLPSSNLFAVGLTSERPEGMAELVNALVNTYVKRERAEDLKRHDHHIEVLQAEQKRVTGELIAKRAQIAEMLKSGATNQGSLTMEYEAESLRKRLDVLDHRLNSQVLAGDAPVATRLFENAREPETPVANGRRYYMILALIGALFLAGLAPIVVDMRDPRLRSAGELQKLTGYPPIGIVADYADGDNQDLARDQITRLAYSIDRERRNNRSKVVLVTSVESGGGTSTIALDLAHALSRLDIRTIALEASALKPDSNYVLPDNDLGLADVLTARCRVSDAINPETDSLPVRMPVGYLDGARQLPDIQYLPGVLRLLTDRYELVIIDSAPLMESPDTELLVGLSDSTVLVVEASKVHYDKVLQATRWLERLSPPVINLVLNRVAAYNSALIDGSRDGR